MAKNLKYGQDDLTDGKHGLTDRQDDLTDGEHDLIDRQNDLIDGKHDLIVRQDDLIDGKHDLIDRQNDLTDGKHELADRQVAGDGACECFFVAFVVVIKGTAENATSAIADELGETVPA